MNKNKLKFQVKFKTKQSEQKKAEQPAPPFQKKRFIFARSDFLGSGAVLFDAGGDGRHLSPTNSQT